MATSETNLYHPAKGSSTKGAANAQADQGLVGRLRSDIVNGGFSPGDRLKFAALSNRYDVGHGSLREALSQLVTEGFATQEINKGFSVALVSKQELLEITEIYIELEQRAIASAIAHGDDTWEATIVAAHHKLHAIEKLCWSERVALHSDWVIRHRDFHKSLVAACTGDWLLRLRTIMFDQLDRYRFVTKVAPNANQQGRAAEHKKLMQAVLDRDSDSACILIDKHVRKTGKKAVKLLDDQELNNRN